MLQLLVLGVLALEFLYKDSLLQVLLLQMVILLDVLLQEGVDLRLSFLLLGLAHLSLLLFGSATGLAGLTGSGTRGGEGTLRLRHLATECL